MTVAGGAPWRERAAPWFPLGTRRRYLAGFATTAGRRLLRVGRAVAADARRTAAQLEVGDPYRRLSDQARRRADRLVPLAIARTANELEVLVVVTGGAGSLGATLASLDAQHWPQWSCEVVDLELPSPSDQARVRRVASFEQALSEVHPGRPVVVLEAGDRLEPDALFRVADAFWENPSLRLVYWDDDVAGASPRLRPSWSPDLLASANYLGRSFSVRATAWASRPAPSSPCDWWELLLESAPEVSQVRRIPLVLSHLPSRHEECPPGAEAVVDAELRRRGWPATARRVGQSIQLEWHLETWPSVSVVIPSRFNRSLLETSLGSLTRTDYPRLEVIVVDNSGRTDDKAAWYSSWEDRLDLRVEWWTDEPFNYSAVNNHAASISTGEVLVFLNDDTEAVDPGWLAHLVGWATRPEIGTVGLQLLDADGAIQHGGVIVGIGGFAGHLFDRIEPHQDTLIGSTDWTRNVLASTGACVALRRGLFEDLGGFDERFVLCGSDVVLGLDAHLRGFRNVCSVGTRVDHLESATRGGYSVPADLYTSWWRYQRWVSAGDPFYSPNLRLVPGLPEPANSSDRTPAEKVGPALGRSFTVFRQQVSAQEAQHFAQICRADSSVVDAVRRGHADVVGHQDVRSVNWFVPDFDNPYYGGINTILRIADHLQQRHGVANRFVVMGPTSDLWYRSAIRAAFPQLGGSELAFVEPGGPLDAVPPADAAVATMWHTAYAVAGSTGQRRRFYLIQDFEPAFYPAGSMYALAEESYRLGLYGVCNTEPMATMYRDRYGGVAEWFMPAVDRRVFHGDRPPRPDGDPVRIFLYARPGHWRNCWEIASGALDRVKRRFGERVHIVTAGSWSRPEDLGNGIEHLGLLEYAETGDLYRRCDIGIALTVSEHPSYLPVELLACGVAVTAFDIPEAQWVLRHEETGLLARRTVDGLAGQIERLVEDGDLRRRLAEAGERGVRERHGDWSQALSGVHGFLCDPERGLRS